MWQGGRNRVEHHRHLAADDLGVGVGAAFERHVIEFDAGGGGKHFRGQMAGRAAAERGKINTARFGFRCGDEVFQRLVTLGRVHHQRLRRQAEIRNRREIVDRIVGQFRIQRGVDAEGARYRHRQRITIGRGFGPQIGAQHRAGARLVIDHHLLVPAFPHFCRDQAGQYVGRSARGKLDNYANLFCRIFASARDASNQSKDDGECDAQFHGFLQRRAGVKMRAAAPPYPDRR